MPETPSDPTRTVRDPAATALVSTCLVRSSARLRLVLKSDPAKSSQ